MGKKSILQIETYKANGRVVRGFIVERRDPHFSNTFIRYKDGSFGFDRSPSKKARKELIAHINKIER